MRTENSPTPPFEDFQAVRGNLTEFGVALQQLILEKNALIQSEKKRHTNNVKGVNLEILSVRTDIEAARIQRDSINEQKETALATFANTEAMAESLSQDLEKAQATYSSMRAALDAKRSKVQKLSDSLRHTRLNLDSQTQKDEGEATKYEMYTGLIVQSVDQDLLRFKFTNVSNEDVDLEVLVDLYVGDDLYRVLATDPDIPPDSISAMEKLLNEHGQLVVFLKQIRKTLKTALGV